MKVSGKFTVVYQDSFMSGCHQCVIGKYAKVETDDLAKLLREDDRFGSAVWFVFEGHCKEQGS